MRISLRSLLLLLFVNNFFYGKTKNDPNVKKVYTTVKIDKANIPTIDGLLNESIWDNGKWGGDFIEFDPDNNTSPSQETKFKISIEAGATNSWEKFIGQKGLAFGIDDFGKSAPYKNVYKHFGLTIENITKKVKEMLNK